MPGRVLSMQNILLGQTKAMQIRQRETLRHQRTIIHEVCLSSAQLVNQQKFSQLKLVLRSRKKIKQILLKFSGLNATNELIDFVF